MQAVPEHLPGAEWPHHHQKGRCTRTQASRQAGGKGAQVLEAIQRAEVGESGIRIGLLPFSQLTQVTLFEANPMVHPGLCHLGARRLKHALGDVHCTNRVPHACQLQSVLTRAATQVEHPLALLEVPPHLGPDGLPVPACGLLLGEALVVLRCGGVEGVLAHAVFRLRPRARGASSRPVSEAAGRSVQWLAWRRSQPRPRSSPHLASRGAGRPSSSPPA